MRGPVPRHGSGRPEPASKGASDGERGPTTAAPGVHPAATCALAWLVPGAGHFLHGQPQKAIVFFVVLTAMFIIGLAFGGRVFPFVIADPLVFLAAAAEWALGGPRLVAAFGGLGAGNVTTVTYEYGNTFLIVSGLLNALVILDAFDLAKGRKPR